jgi:phosphatidylglycerophosphatase C
MTDGGRVRRVAAFDFDGTVSRRDTLVPFVAGVVGLPRSVAGGVAAAWSGLVRREFDPRDRDELKAHMVERLLAGRSERELERAAGLYATKLLDAGLRPEVVDQVRRHVAAGHETLFVSASLVYYLRPIARHLHTHRRHAGPQRPGRGEGRAPLGVAGARAGCRARRHRAVGLRQQLR